MNPRSDELPTRLDRTVLYESRWVSLYRDKVALPNGRILEQYHVLDFGRGAVAVIVENDRGQILMEQVPRYPTGMTSWELPAGHIEGDESVFAAAKREVMEETGYNTHSHSEVYQFHPQNGISNMRVHVVHCQAGTRCGQLDDDEVAAIQWFSMEELSSMIERREIVDAFALIGLLLHAAKTQNA
jgi:ADP-ribose pyrophosphatase